MKQQKFREPTLWIALLGGALASMAFFFRLRFPFDDTFISFRYAEHLAAAEGLVWNIGGAHTEGYTNFFYILLLASLRLLHLDLLASSQVFALACTVISAVLIYHTTEINAGRRAGVLASVLFYSYPLTWINALSGMETSLAVLLCALTFYLYTLRGASPLTFFAIFLATLTRPEVGILAFLLVAVSLLPNQTFSPRGFIVGFLLPLTVYLVWKYFYFGSLLPNSFYVKVLSETNTRTPGLQYVRLFVTSVLPMILASCLVWKRRDKVSALLCAWTLALLGFYIFVLPLEGLYDRFLQPAFVALCILAAMGLFEGFKPRMALVAGVLLIAAQTLVSALTPRTSQSLQAHEEQWDASMDSIAAEIRMLPHQDSLLLAYGDAGYVVYRSGVRHLDLVGLNTNEIAHARGTTERAQALLHDHPDCLLLPVRQVDDNCFDLVENAFGVIGRSNDRFTPVAQFAAFPYPLVLYLDRSSPYCSDITSWLEKRRSSSTSMLKAPPSCMR